MAWLYLFIAGIFEIFWAVGIKHINELKITLPLVLVIVAMIFSIIFLGLAVKTIPISIAYAVWTGIGIVGVYTYGVLILKDPFSIANTIFVGMILIGIVGLKLGAK